MKPMRSVKNTAPSNNHSTMIGMPGRTDQRRLGRVLAADQLDFARAHGCVGTTAPELIRSVDACASLIAEAGTVNVVSRSHREPRPPARAPTPRVLDLVDQLTLLAAAWPANNGVNSTASSLDPSPNTSSTPPDPAGLCIAFGANHCGRHGATVPTTPRVPRNMLTNARLRSLQATKYRPPLTWPEGQSKHRPTSTTAPRTPAHRTAQLLGVVSPVGLLASKP
jgi:hypothetical protein